MESRQPHPQQAFSEVPILASGLPIIPTVHRTTAIVFDTASANLRFQLGGDINLDGAWTCSISLAS
jgi:hypothetical protein